MSNSNNPAGRLHAILKRYEESRAANLGLSLEAVWEDALNLSGVELRVTLARVAGLVPSLARAAQDFEADHGDTSTLDVVETHCSEWVKPLVLPPIAASAGVNTEHARVSKPAMVALASLAFTLGQLLPEARHLSEETRDSLASEVAKLISDLRGADDLPDNLRMLMMDCLHGIEDALDHYAFGGSGETEAAYDRLLAALMRTYKEHHDKTWWQHAQTVVLHGYAALGVAVTLNDGLTLIDGVAGSVSRIAGA